MTKLVDLKLRKKVQKKKITVNSLTLKYNKSKIRTKTKKLSATAIVQRTEQGDSLNYKPALSFFVRLRKIIPKINITSSINNKQLKLYKALIERPRAIRKFHKQAIERTIARKEKLANIKKLPKKRRRLLKELRRLAAKRYKQFGSFI